MPQDSPERRDALAPDGFVEETTAMDAADWDNLRARTGGAARFAKSYLGTFKTSGNMFGAAKLVEDLATVRREIAYAVLLSYSRRTLGAGERAPDLKELRKLETELIVRLDLLGGMTPGGDVRPGAARPAGSPSPVGLRQTECVAVLTRDGDKFEMVGWENDRISIRVQEREPTVVPPTCVVDFRDVRPPVWAAFMALADAIKQGAE